ncbi:MAG: hypothetical protein CMH57_00255 [Myxococcales bacterium]|nr:hypothetical protein [Myxococcales bacterium]
MDVFDAVVQNHRAALRADAVAAAHALGLFPALLTPTSPTDLADHLALNPRRLRPLLDVLTLEGLLTRDTEGRLSLTEAPQGPSPEPSVTSGWGRLAQALRDDSPAPGGDWPLPPEGLRRYHAHLVAVGAVAARELVEHLAPAAGALLDLGGGAGCYSEAWLSAAPSNRATLCDRPEVAALARGRLGESRVAYREGDLFETPWGEGFDVALLANVLHLVGPEACRALIRRAAAAVRVGGLVCVKDLWIDEDRLAPATSVYFALNMALFTEGGDVHAPRDIAGWLAAEGLGEIQVARLPSGGVSVTGRRLG